MVTAGTLLSDPHCVGRAWLAPRSPDYVTPGSPRHSEVISPSKVAAIMGLSRWESAYRLWHRMKGLVPDEPESDRFMVGHAMELAAAYMYREDHPGWRVSLGEVQVQTDLFGFPAVATLDRRATKPVGRGNEHRVLEIKTTESLEDWGDQRTDQAPRDYTVQVIALMGFSGYTKHPAHLVLLGPRISQRHEYEIPFAEDIFEWVLEDCSIFYESLAKDDPPPLDNSVATYEARIELLDKMERAQHARIGDTIVARRQNSGRGSVALVSTGAELPDLVRPSPGPDTGG
jgi:predicted phage-related endonuclease